MNRISELINYAEKPSEIVVTQQIKEMIENEHRHLQSILNRHLKVYGSNTLVGHKDEQDNNNDDYLEQIIKSHSIGFGDGFSEAELKYIAVARILSWKAGKTGVSLDSFENFITYYQSNQFKPYIPKNCSYSSGDVIPATHLLESYLNSLDNLEERKAFKTTDIMPFINGNFVQVGFAGSLLDSINELWSLFLYNSLINYKLFNGNESNFVLELNDDKRLNKLSELFIKISNGNKKRQDIISIRSLPQQFSKFIDSFTSFIQTIELSLNKPSGNPLVDLDYDEAISQASFLSLDLSDVTLSLLNSLKLLTSVTVNRTTFLLSGNIEGIPQDCSIKSGDLGLIQVPKLMMAIEEKISLSMPSANLYNTKITSNGIEDLWNNGLNILVIAQEVIKQATELLTIELFVHRYLESSLAKMETSLDALFADKDPALIDALNQGLNEVANMKLQDFMIESNRLKDIINQFSFIQLNGFLT